MTYKVLSGGYPSGYTMKSTSTYTGVSVTATGSVGGSGLLVQKAGAVVINSGSLLATSFGSPGVQLTGTGSVTNTATGTISGQAGVVGAVTQALTVSNLAGGHISGTAEAVDLIHGGYVSNAGYLTSAGSGVFAQGALTTIVNTGSVSATGTAGVGVDITGGGKIVNGAATLATASVIGVADGVLASGPTALTLTNYAVVQATGTASVGVYFGFGTGGTITNAGTASLIEGATGVYLRGADSLVNAGTVLGQGAATFAVTLAGGGSVSNSGLIKGASGVKAGSAKAVTLTNSGAIDSTAGAAGVAVHFYNSGDRLVLQAGASFAGKVMGGNGTLELAAPGPGTLTGLGSAYSGFSALKVDKGAAWTLAGANTFSGIATNDGSFTLTGTLANTGSIVAPTGYGDGLYLATGATLTNGSSLNAFSLISGLVGVDAVGAATVINYGTISSNVAPAGTAVSFTNSLDRLVVEPGAVFVGTVAGGAGALELAAGAGTLTGLGSVFTGFATYGVDAGGYWTLAGANTLAAGATLTNSGTLTVTGSFANHGTIIGDGLTLASAATVQNYGLISGSAGAKYPSGVTLTGSGLVSNAAGGTIHGSFWGVYASNGATISNSGLLSGVAGLEIRGAGAYITNTATGTISGASNGLVTYQYASLNNSGLITGSFTGFEGAGTNFVTNKGTIQSTHAFAVFLSGDHGTQDVLINNGVVAGGVETFGCLFVDNYGSIAGSYAYTGKAYKAAGVYVSKSGYSFVASTVINKGQISGAYGVVLGDTATLTNFGTVGGKTDAVKFGSAGDRLIVEGGAAFAGSVVGGGGTLEMAGAAGAGTLVGPGTSFSGFAAYIVDSGATWTLAATDTVTNAATVTDQGALTNLGTVVSSVYRAAPAVSVAAGAALVNGSKLNAAAVISGLSGVIAANGATISNFATIQGLSGATKTGGVYLTGGGLVTNLAGGLIEGINGVYLQSSAAGTVLNSGVIQGGPSAAIRVAGGTVSAPAQITNSAGGTITAFYQGISAFGAATIANSGVITESGVASNDAAVNFYAGGVVTNLAAGLIEGSGNGVYGSGGANSVVNYGLIRTTNLNSAMGVAIYVKSGGASITNAASGTILGGEGGIHVGFTPATIVNAGSINSDLFGVLTWGVATVTNTGTIGGGDYGVSLVEGAASTLLNQGLITGGFLTDGNDSVTNYGTILGDHVYQGVTIHKMGVYFRDSGGGPANAVINKGLISGTYGVKSLGPLTVTNFGTISGTSAAINFGSASDRLIAEGASAFSGVVRGGGGTLEMGAASGAGTLTGLGTNFTGFAAYAIDAGASWTLAGANALAAGLTLTNKGTLTVSGSMTNLGAIVAPSGYHDGVHLGSGAALTNGSSLNSAAIISGHYGVVAGAGTTVTNYGTIAGAGLFAVEFSSSTVNRLVARSGAVFTGRVEGGAGTLELGAAIGTIHGIGAGVNTITGGVSMSDFYFFNAYQLDTGGAWTLTGANTLTSGKRLTDNAQLTIATGGSLAIDNQATASVQGAVTNAGSISIISTGSRTDLRVDAGGATFNGAGTVSLVGPKSRIWGTATSATLTNVDNTISGAGWLGLSEMTLVNQAKGVIEAVGKQGLVVNTKGATSTNAGLIESFTGSVLTLQNSTLDQSGGGTIAALTGGRVLLSDDAILGGTLSQAGTGVFNVNTSGGAWQAVTLGGVIQVLRGVTLNLDGAIANGGKLRVLGAASATKLIVGADGVTLSGGGQVNTSASVNNIIVGAASTDTFTNLDNRIAGAGNIGGGSMVLVNKGQIIGNTAVTLTIDTGASTITNTGTIESVSSGQVVVKSAVANTGLLFAAAGTLTLNGAVTGTGTGQIKNGVLNIAATFGETVTFVTGGTGQLRLTDWVDFTGTVKGLSLTGTNAIDLAGFTKTGTTATYTGTTTSGVLTVSNGTQTAKISLTGNYTASTFTLANDGHGGVIVKDPAVPSGGALPATPLIAAMAGFGARPSGPSVIAPQPWGGPRLEFAIPRAHGF